MNKIVTLRFRLRIPLNIRKITQNRPPTIQQKIDDFPKYLSEKHHHDDHASEKITATVVDSMPSLSLTEKTQKKFDKITEKYNEEKSELDADYKADIKKLLTDDEYAIFLQQIGDHSHKKSCCKTK